MFQPSEILGVPVNADPATIKAAYRKLVKENHPDIAGKSQAASDRMVQINLAYDAMKKGIQPDQTKTRQAQTNTQSQEQKPKHEPFTWKNFDEEQSPKRPRSPFGFKRAKEEAARKAQAEQNDYDRQKRAWTQDQDTMAQKNAAGKDDWSKAQEDVRQAGGDTMSEAEKRTAELRALRERRSQRNSGPTMYNSRVQPSTEHVKKAYRESGIFQNDPKIRLEIIESFTKKSFTEMTTTQTQDRKLEAKLDEARNNEARNAVANRRAGKPTTQPGAFHKAQKISIEGDTINIHLGSRGLKGRNIIATPTFTKAGNNIRMGNDVQAFAMSLNQDGKQAHTGAEAMLLKNSNMKVAIHFSDQKENLRAKTRETTR